MSVDLDYTIDPAALARVLRMGGATLLSRLVETALGNLATRRAELASALLSGDIAAAERAAHSLKSSSRNLGATHLGNLAEKAEELARENAAGWQEAAKALLAADLEALEAALQVACREQTAAAENRKAP